MKRFGFMAAGMGSLALFGATGAHAQSTAKLTEGVALTPVALQSADAPPPSLPFSVPTPKKSLQLDSHGRWGLRLDMEKPTSRNMDWKDVEAGAYFKVTPTLRVGASAGVDARSDLAPAPRKPEPVAPRVRLETAFKF